MISIARLLLLTVCLLASHAGAKAERKNSRTTMLSGLSRVIEFPKGFGSVRSSSPGVLAYTRLPRKKNALGLLLLAKQPGVAEIEVLNKQGGLQKQLRFQVVAGDVPSIAEAQKAMEKKAGLTIVSLDLGTGEGKTVDFSREVGPIYLSDPDVLDFRRVVGKGRETKSVTLVGKTPGLTDLTVNDVHGLAQVKYYVRVAAKRDVSAK